MEQTSVRSTISWVAACAALILGPGLVAATEPCGDFGECKALIEINATDGDIGFHFLMDGDDLNSGEIADPNGTAVFKDQAKGPLKEQKLTETFAESAEPQCWTTMVRVTRSSRWRSFSTGGRPEPTSSRAREIRERSRRVRRSSAITFRLLPRT